MDGYRSSIVSSPDMCTYCPRNRRLQSIEKVLKSEKLIREVFTEVLFTVGLSEDLIKVSTIIWSRHNSSLLHMIFSSKSAMSAEC